jgi:hypothetical protein
MEDTTNYTLPQKLYARTFSVSWLKKKTIVEIVCFLFTTLFVYASLSKFIEYEKFTVQLGQSPLLTAFAKWIAWLIPSLEILISLMMTLPKLRLIGLYASFSLMVMFTTYIIAITKFSDYIPCSCGGILQNMSWNQHLIFNVAFVFLAIIAIMIYPEKKRF